MENKKLFSVKILMGAIQYATGQLAELDEDFRQKLEGIDTVIQWKVEPDGPNSYTVVKDSKIDFVMDEIHENPTFTFSCDLDTALELFQGKVNANAALEEGKVKVDGPVDEAQKNIFILETLAEYLSGISGGR